VHRQTEFSAVDRHIECSAQVEVSPG